MPVQPTTFGAPTPIGFLEWNGKAWMDQSEAAFIANEDWERGSVYEPNLIYHDGKWKMWCVAGSNHEDYLIHVMQRAAMALPAGANMLFLLGRK
jgi:hypothetical protein